MKKYMILALVIAAIAVTAVPVFARTPSNAFDKCPSGSGGTDAVDLDKWDTLDGTSIEVIGLLPADAVGNGISDAQVSNDLTLSTGSSVDNTPIGASIPSTGAFTTGSFTGLVSTAASAAGGAGFRLGIGAAPTAPVDGDCWMTAAGFYYRANGTTYGPCGGFTLTGYQWEVSGGNLLLTDGVNTLATFADGGTTGNFSTTGTMTSAGLATFTLGIAITDFVITDTGSALVVTDGSNTMFTITDGGTVGNVTVSGTLTSTGASTLVGDVTLDDGAGASPSLTFKDVTDETAVFSKADSGYLTVTTLAADGLGVVTGNFKVGSGTPDVTLNGADAYVTGTFEADGAARFDGAVTANGTFAAASTLSITDFVFADTGTAMTITDGVNNMITLTDAGTTGNWAASGDVTAGGDLDVHGGDITTDDLTVNVLTATATKLNVGTVAAIDLSGVGLMTTVKGTLNADAAVTCDTTLGVTGDTTLTGDLALNGADLTSSAATVQVFDMTTTKINLGGAAAVDIGCTLLDTAVKGTLSVAEAATFTSSMGVTGYKWAASGGDLVWTDGTNTMLTLSDEGTTGDLTVSKDLITTGDVAVNGADITSSAATVNVFNAIATKVNIGGAAAVDLGKTLLATTVKGTFNTDEAATFDTTLGVTGNTTLTGDLALNGADLTSTATTVQLFDDTVTKLNVGGAAAIDLSVSGSDTAVKGTLSVAEVATFTGDIHANSDEITSTALTVSVFDSTTTMLNVGGAATMDLSGAGLITTVKGQLNVDQATTLDTTLRVSSTSRFDGDVTLDDDSGASPSLIIQDATNETALFSKVDSGYLTVTTVAADGVSVRVGNLTVGDGTAGVNVPDGEDLYVEGTSEFDGVMQLDGAVTATAGITSNVFTGLTAVNAGSKISRNQATTTTDLLELEITDASDDHTALLIDANSTGAVDAAEIETAGTAAGLHITTEAAAGTGLDLDFANSMTGRALYADLGTWLGTGGAGALEIVTDAATQIPAGQLVRLDQNGTGQHAAAIEGTVLYVADAATAPGAGTSYAVSIDATNIEALHVDTGKALFDEDATFTSDIIVNGGDITGAAAMNLLNVTTTDLHIGGVAAIDLSGTGLMTTVKGTLNTDEAVTMDTTLNVTGVITAANAANAITIGTSSVMTSPPAIGSVAANTGKFSTLEATGVFRASTVTQFADVDATPTVAAGNVFRCYGREGLTITDFDNHSDYQVITVLGAFLNEIQTVVVTDGATTDSFTLTYNPGDGAHVTSSLLWNCSAAEMVTALEALDHIEVGDVAIVLAPAGTYTITFQGTLAETDVTQLVSTDTDCTVTDATTTAGATACTSVVDDCATVQLASDWTMTGGATLQLIYDAKKAVWRELCRAAS